MKTRMNKVTLTLSLALPLIAASATARACTPYEVLFPTYTKEQMAFTPASTEHTIARNHRSRKRISLN